MNEANNCAQRFLGRIEIPAMQSQLVIAVAHEHCTIRCKPTPISPIESQSAKVLAQLVGISRTIAQLERELLAPAIESEKSL